MMSHERPVPSIGPGEMLVRIIASGICGSDVMEWYRLDRAPLVLGHEIAERSWR
jgi:L-iditol 2-dehydrogenase